MQIYIRRFCAGFLFEYVNVDFLVLFFDLNYKFIIGAILQYGLIR